MTGEEFQREMNRLVTQFGKNQYTEERAKLIWREVKELTPKWWEQTIDKFIGEERQPPLMPQFRVEIAKERERLWRIQKQQHAQESKDFFEGTSIQDEERRIICRTIINRIQGGVSDQDFESFQKMLNNMAASSRILKY